MRDEEGEPVPLRLSLRQYREARINASGSQFVLDGHVDDLDCKSIFTVCKRFSDAVYMFGQSTFLEHCTATLRSGCLKFLKIHSSISE